MNAVIDPQAAAQACQDIERRLMDMPIEELRKAHRQMAIEAHNLEVERKKAEKKRAKAKAGPKRDKFRISVHSSQYPDLRG